MILNKTKEKYSPYTFQHANAGALDNILTDSLQRHHDCDLSSSLLSI